MGAHEYLEKLAGKIRKCLFIYVKILKNNSVVSVPRKENQITLEKVVLTEGQNNYRNKITLFFEIHIFDLTTIFHFW